MHLQFIMQEEIELELFEILKVLGKNNKSEFEKKYQEFYNKYYNFKLPKISIVHWISITKATNYTNIAEMNSIDISSMFESMKIILIECINHTYPLDIILIDLVCQLRPSVYYLLEDYNIKIKALVSEIGVPGNAIYKMYNIPQVHIDLIFQYITVSPTFSDNSFIQNTFYDLFYGS